jgi:hypothetical protein
MPPPRVLATPLLPPLGAEASHQRVRAYARIEGDLGVALHRRKLIGRSLSSALSFFDGRYKDARVHPRGMYTLTHAQASSPRDSCARLL